MVQKDRMSPNEIKASSILASIYALRMLGIFLILPIFSIYAAELPSQPSIFQIGLALGIYGLTQAIFQIPFGMVSDVIGRKKVVYFGLVLFIVGSLCAGLTNDIELIILGRAIQGAGAISAVLSAFSKSEGILSLTKWFNRRSSLASSESRDRWFFSRNFSAARSITVALIRG